MPVSGVFRPRTGFVWMNADQHQDLQPDEIRDALQRVLASPEFAHAPQLSAFLRFVVESVLTGQTDYIKGYTIAVGALGRADSFDPRLDPIVRVEAGRLRRALSRYYASVKGEGAIVIELPLGTYVPVFYRAKRKRSTAQSVWHWRRQLGALPRVAVAMSVVFIALACFGLVATLSSLRHAMSPTNTVLTTGPPIELLLPLVSIQAFETVRASPEQKLEIDAFRGRLRDALARFDEIEVAEGDQPPQPPARSTYRLAGTAEYHDDTITLSLWLNDADEGTVAWTQAFEIQPAGARAAINDVVQQVATKLAQPYGVIYARELADNHVDPRYRCIVSAFEFRRWFTSSAGGGVDSCLAELTALNPSFADGFAMRSLTALHRYYEGKADSAAAIEQAVAWAQKAVDLKPHSARARQALMNALFYHGEIAAALAEGETAVSLNPNDMIVLHAHGIHLLIAGHAEEGATLVRRAAALSPVRPAMFEFGLFLAAYVLGDYENAEAQARLFSATEFPLNLVARAVIAARDGDAARARQAIERLSMLDPDWRINMRPRLQRYFPSVELLDRLMRDLSIVDRSSAN